MDTVWKIYALIDPRTGEPRYVGQTRRTLRSRFTQHLEKRGSTHRECWIKQLKNEGLQPVMCQLYECFDGGTADAAEIFFIADFKARGFSLTNHASGGDSGCIVYDSVTREKMRIAHLGKKATPEAIQKKIKTMTGHPVSQETRDRIRDAKNRQYAKNLEMFGYKRSPVTAEKIRRANLGRKLSDATKAKLSADRLGKKKSEETRARMSKAQKNKIVSEAALARIREASAKRVVSDETRLRMREKALSRLSMPGVREELEKRLKNARERRKLLRVEASKCP